MIILSIYLHKNNTSKISFKESLDLLNLPIVTFTNNGYKLHFLLDTGSDDSFIVPDVLDKLNILEKKSLNHKIATGGGDITSKGLVELDIFYKNVSFRNVFVVSDMGCAFENAVGSKGITIHGILGSIFFSRYKYILDFNKLEFYSKKL